MIKLSHGQVGSEVANTLIYCIASYKGLVFFTQHTRFGTRSIIFTYLDELIPARRDNDGVLGVGAEAHARNPLGVALIGDGVLAVTEGVPELDGTVTGARNDLAVVGREGDGEDIVGVANETTSGGTSGQLPEAKSLVPRSGQSVSAVRGDHLRRLALLFLSRSRIGGKYVHSRRRCGSVRGESAWGNRIGSRRG